MSIVLKRDSRNGFVGLLLAAGAGARFRASAGHAEADKLLARLADGRVVSAASAAALHAASTMVVAVLRPGAAALRATLEEAGCVAVEAEDAACGMGASLAAGARFLMRCKEAEGARACLVALGDMPWIRPSTMMAVCDAAQTHRIAAPVYQGRRGHPVAFAWDLLPELAALDGDTGARALLARHGVCDVPCDDPGVLRDVDTVSDL